MAKSGKLRRLARRLYDDPKVHPKLGQLSPAPDDVARALARQTESGEFHALMAAYQQLGTETYRRNLIDS